MKAGRKPVFPTKTPDDELRKMPHTKSAKFQPPPMLQPALWHWRQAFAGTADLPTTAPHVPVLVGAGIF